MNSYQYPNQSKLTQHYSGTVRDDIAAKSGNKFAVESCHIKLKDSDLSAHVWRSLYDVARQYRESIDVYGTKKSFEWTLVENEPREAIQ